MNEMLDWWNSLNQSLKSLPPREADRRRYIELSKLHLDAPKWRQWGKELLEAGLDPFPYIYTPGIGTAILAYREGFDITKEIPGEIQPLDLVATLDLFDIDSVKEEILKKATQIHALQKSNTPFDPLLPKPLKNFGVVISNKRRVLGFGEVPLGGEWITRGKADCYEMATDGKVGLIIPIGINVEGIKKDDEKHDAYIEEVLQLLELLGVNFIQFEDFDGESAFRILEWSRVNLRTPVFNDDIEGTAWIILLAKLAAKQRYKSLRFEDSLFIFHGGGGAAVGTANFLEEVLREEYVKAGMKADDADRLIHRQFLTLDSAGLLYEGRTVKSKKGKEEYKLFQRKWVLKDFDLLNKIKKDGESLSLIETIEVLGESILGPNGSIFLIGLSTNPNQFTKDVIEMGRKVMDKDEKRKDLPLFIDSCSNPTQKTEILTLEESEKIPKANEEEKQKIIEGAIERVFTAANQRVSLTTGSPMHHPKYMVSQLNNFLGFPAAGLALLTRNSDSIDIHKLGKSIAETNLRFLMENEKERFEKGALCPTSKDLLELTQKAAKETFF